jgi:hypothetical protein
MSNRDRARGVVLLFLPPVLVLAFHRLFDPPASEESTGLFDGDDRMFKTLVGEAEVYGEYGVGESTVYVLENTRAQVMAVDTSSEWTAAVTSNATESLRLDVRHVDVGPTGSWGTPLSYARRENFPSYAGSIWERAVVPDLVLVDGRFRVLCFLTSLLRAPSGTKVVFDDYVSRPEYHVVEEIIKPVELCGRQALFVVPERFDRAATEQLAAGFTLVWR